MVFLILQDSFGDTKVFAVVLKPRKSPIRARAAGNGASGPKRPSSTATSMGRRMKLLRDGSTSQAWQMEKSMEKNGKNLWKINRFWMPGLKASLNC